MEAFLVRFYKAVDRNLGDPHASVRYPKSDRLADLHDVDREVFESLLKSTGQESLLGYSEATITLKNGVDFYNLPAGFRQFIELQRRTANGRIKSIIRTKPYYDSAYGVDILTSSRGFRLFPAPTLDGDQDWILIYGRSTGLLHYALASAVGNRTITSGVPGTDAGDLVLIDDYYNGMELRVYQADSGVPQEREILSYKVLDSKTGVFNLRHPFSPIPTGDVWYEIMPVLPYPYDSIYAMDVALLALDRREKPIKANSLIKQRRKKWAAAKQYFLSNVSDRGPSRTMPLKPSDLAATGEIPY